MPGASAIGKTFRTRSAEGPLVEIVGVSADHKITAVGEGPTPFIQVPRSQAPNSYSFVLARTRGDAGSLRSGGPGAPVGSGNRGSVGSGDPGSVCSGDPGAIGPGDPGSVGSGDPGSVRSGGPGAPGGQRP